MSIEKYKIDYSEDKDITKIAAKKIFFNDVYFVAVFLICLGILLGSIIISNISKFNSEIIAYKSENKFVSIKNASANEKITNKVFNRNDKYVVEQIASIEYENMDIIKDNYVKYNLRLNITENDFPYNTVGSVDSNVLVRFSYSYDKEEWDYINNVITIKTGTINPLMGKYYDVSGVIDNLKILTDIELKVPKIYWKCEIFFRSFNKLIDNTFASDFKIELSK